MLAYDLKTSDTLHKHGPCDEIYSIDGTIILPIGSIITSATLQVVGVQGSPQLQLSPDIMDQSWITDTFEHISPHLRVSFHLLFHYHHHVILSTIDISNATHYAWVGSGITPCLLKGPSSISSTSSSVCKCYL